jgi:hypothetical protein
MSLNKMGIACGQVEVKLRLYILSKEGAGILEIILTDETNISIYLKGRHIKLLIIHNKALIADRNLENEDARGWLTNEQIALIYDKEYPKAIVPGANVFTVYRSQINKAIKKELSRQHPSLKAPSLFRSEKNVGTRLVSELEIIDLSGRDAL